MMQVLRTIAIIVLFYYLFKVIRRLMTVSKNGNSKSKTQKSSQKKKGKMELKDVEDAEYEEIK